MAAHKNATVEKATALLHNPPMLFIVGLATLIAGLAMVLVHNVWCGGALPIIVTLVGWLTLIKGLLFLFLPAGAAVGFFLGGLHYEHVFYLYAAMCFVFGAYLTYGGFRSTSCQQAPAQGRNPVEPGGAPWVCSQSVAADRQLPLKVRELLAAKAHVLHLADQEMVQVSSELNLSPEFLSAGLGTLSGGQFQKVLIPFVLLGRPNMLLFDEPTASLDELTEERIYELVHHLHSQKGITVILVSHDLSIVYRYASRVLCLSKGKVCLGAPKEILTPEMLGALYGAPPKYYGHIQKH
jgi:energy-coupling factor transporter transmembrane protein EcfT